MREMSPASRNDHDPIFERSVLPGMHRTVCDVGTWIAAEQTRVGPIEPTRPPPVAHGAAPNNRGESLFCASLPGTGH